MQDAQVLIIGAGPAGAIAAAQLASAGHRVRVVEKEKFPRFSIGESLLAQSLELIEKAGMLEATLAAGFQFKNGATFVRGAQRAEFNFAEKICPGYGYTFQVPRAQFDALLADEAVRMGAQIEFEVKVIAVDVSGARPMVETCDHSGRIETHRPLFVLDASGFGRTLPRLLGLEKRSEFPPRSALFTHIEDHIEAGAFDRQKILISVHPQQPDIWYWLIPFSTGRSSLGVVVPPLHFAGQSSSTDDRLWQLVAENPPLQELLVNARPVPPVGEITGYAAAVTTLHGRGFALLGNAAEFLDPVFSSGVTIAIKSAQLAAAAVSRQLRGEEVDWDADFTKPLMLGVETFRGFVSGWYDGSLQDVIFHPRQDPKVRRMICAVLAGYAWDESNPYVGPQAGRRLRALAAHCRDAA